ncbi:MAG: tetratricopeptide repeat protein [Hyphomicrobium sp.]|nr:tetratricopeptide repeat protein [Hyphomicrobium sp.]
MTYARILASVAAALAFGAAAALATVDNPTLDCLSDDNERRISGCSALIETPGLPDDQRSLAYGMRALAYSLLGIFDKALSDYDAALDIKPDFPLALNNRAWSYYKLGRPRDGIGDVEKALQLAPGSPYALDTRAHIRQALGDAKAAFDDYDLAMRAGGARIVKMYQCGLRSPGPLLRRDRRRLFLERAPSDARLHRQSPLRSASIRFRMPSRGFLKASCQP